MPINLYKSPTISRFLGFVLMKIERSARNFGNAKLDNACEIKRVCGSMGAPTGIAEAWKTMQLLLTRSGLNPDQT